MRTLPRLSDGYDRWRQLGVAGRPYLLPGLKKETTEWGPAGITGPCGPDTEMFIDAGKACLQAGLRPGMLQGNISEIWNDVFMGDIINRQTGPFVPLEQKNVDTGMGLDHVRSRFCREKGSRL